MKKFLALFLSLMLVFAVAGVASAAGVDDNIIDAGDIFGYAAVYFNDAEVQVSSTVTVDVKIKNNAGFTKLVITAESDGVELVGAQNGTGTTVTFQNGEVTVLADPALAGQDIVVAKLQFKGVTVGKNAVALSLAAFAGEDEFETGKVTSYITVKVAYTLGDIDNNGDINVADLGLLKKHVANIDLIANPAVGDMDGNGTVNVTDLGILKKKVAGIE